MMILTYTYICTNNNDDVGGDEYDVTCHGWIIFSRKKNISKNDYHDIDRNDKSP